MKSHTFHVLGLAHQPITDQVPSCAYTAKVLNMCRMLMAANHRVVLYGAGVTNAPCSEFVQCVSDRTLQEEFGGRYDLTYNDANLAVRCWAEFNKVAVRQIGRRLTDEDDIVLSSYGTWQKNACPSEAAGIVIEMGVGYGGIFARRKVFESYAWQHYVYGETKWTQDFRDADTVIPNYLNPEEFTVSLEHDSYLLYLGRVIEAKGVLWAYQMAIASGHKLIIAGPGDKHWIAKNCPKAEYVGMVGKGERAFLLSRAKALLAPTLYLEPFGGVAIEAAYSGTPVIATDWGGFTETVIDGVTGFRIRTPAMGVASLQQYDFNARRSDCAEWGARFTLDKIWPRYENYFERQLLEYRQ